MSRNSALLPKTFGSDSVQGVLDGLDSEDINIVIQSYAALPSSIGSLGHESLDDSYARPQSHMKKLQERLVSALEQALAIICRTARLRDLRHTDAVAGACQLLAEFTERGACVPGSDQKS